MTQEKLIEEGVSRPLALDRSAVISELEYRIGLELIPGAARLKGSQIISMKLARAGEPVILDFRDLDQNGRAIEGTAGNIRINDRPVDDYRRINGHLVLPARYFKAGANTIELDFETGAAPAGRPIIRYRDQDDGSEYIYTLLVPMDASMAFPCFDQPDSKARFRLEIDAPAEWTVIGNEIPESSSESPIKNFRRTTFRPTPPISTYLFAFAAGPFKRIAGADSAVPSSLYVRQSKAGRAAEEWPEVERLAREGMSHFIDYFGHRFPFSKYDQVLIPGFAYGGMEHAGATFLREDSILFRTVPTRNDKLGRASLILHELAHQWFGDLVTMRWFDDLWLKEGFANLMAYHAMSSIYDRDEIWKRFYQVHKPTAYQIDSTPGTTPIYQVVPNLKDAKSAYGAIVYQKAPAILRALSFVIGEEKFRDGIRLFVRQHAYGNAEWSDLIRSLETTSGRELADWAEEWVRRRGMPQIDVVWKCNDQGKIDLFELRQRDVLQEGDAWPIRTRVLMAYDDQPSSAMIVNLNDARVEVGEAKGRKCPAWVFANDGDFAYGRFMLDERSRSAIIERLGAINDPFLRTMLWGALWDVVREAEMDPADYITLALELLPGENDEELAQNILDCVSRAFERYLGEPRRKSFAPRLERLLFDRMLEAKETGLRITFFRAFRAIASTLDARRQLKDILNGKIAVPGVDIKPLDRWRIITALLGERDDDAERLLTSERSRDTSDDARKQSYIAEAARADKATKERYFNDYLNNPDLPEDWIEGSLAPFNSLSQSTLTAPFLNPALEALPRIKRQRKIFFVLAWLNGFIGGQTGREALRDVRDFLKAAEIDRDLELKILEVTDELERTVRIREKWEERDKTKRGRR